jgi:hypothetical protein
VTFDEHADLILHSGKLTTLDPANPAASQAGEAIRRTQASTLRPRRLQVELRLKDSQWVATARQRLQSISWFMKSLKEPRRAGTGQSARQGWWCVLRGSVQKRGDTR